MVLIAQNIAPLQGADLWSADSTDIRLLRNRMHKEVDIFNTLAACAAP